MTPRELGVINSSKDTQTRKKKIIETKHGSFNLLGLMQKSKQAAETLGEEEKKADAKAAAKRVLEAKKNEDLLSFKLCQRKCGLTGGCTTAKCKWEHFTLCPKEDCGELMRPLLTCQSVNCVKQRKESKKAAVTAKNVKDVADLKSYTECTTTSTDSGMCLCPGPCVWRFHRLCENPPCGALLQQGVNCRKRLCAKYRRDNGIQAQSAKPRLQSSKAANISKSLKSKKKKGKSKATKTKTSTASDSDSSKESQNSHAREPSESSENDYEIEAIVSGPCRKKGPNNSKYEIKWMGYDSDENTWEPRAHIPDKAMQEYEIQSKTKPARLLQAKMMKPSAKNTASSSDSEDGIPFATLLAKK